MLKLRGALSPDLATLRFKARCFLFQKYFCQQLVCCLMVFNYHCSDSRWQHILFYTQLCILYKTPLHCLAFVNTAALETLRDLLCTWHFNYKVALKRWLWSEPITGLWCNFMTWRASQSRNDTFIKQAIHSWTKWSKSFPVKWLQSHGDPFMSFYTKVRSSGSLHECHSQALTGYDRQGSHGGKSGNS